MQATQTTRRFHLGQFKHITLVAGLLVILAIGAATLALADAFPTIGGSESQAVAAPRISSDELYALEAGLAGSQVDGWQATVSQITSDEAWAIEASLVEVAMAYQHNQIMQLTPDEAWAIEQSQLLAGSSEQRAGR